MTITDTVITVAVETEELAEQLDSQIQIKPATDRVGSTSSQRAHPSGLNEEQLQAFGEELDALRDEILGDLGKSDADYIHKIIATQRRLEVAGRLTLFGGVLPPLWLAGVAMLGTAKILENMEIGHNILHGQWDWMRDPDIHSS
ncbi:MAG TPA: hypothetical protein VMU77_05025, partial [Acidimicrobiales bacterium]|nr:hypothetical protein [Acidimicrobiales bacterium]